MNVLDNEQRRDRKHKYHADYRERNRLAIRERARLWREANPDKVDQHYRTYYLRQAQKAEGVK